MRALIKYLLSDQKGATAVEMGLILALIVLGMMTALQKFAAGNMAMWNNIAEKTATAING